MPELFFILTNKIKNKHKGGIIKIPSERNTKTFQHIQYIISRIYCQHLRTNFFHITKNSQSLQPLTTFTKGGDTKYVPQKILKIILPLCLPTHNG